VRRATPRARIAAAIAALACALGLIVAAPLAGTLAVADDAPSRLDADGSAVPPRPSGWVAQIGTYDYLVQPDYDGLAPVRAAMGASKSDRPTIGLGTFDRLNGELVMVGGTVYRVGTDGAPRAVPISRSTPFFEAVRFTPQASMRVPAGTQCSALVPMIDELAATSGGMVAVRMNGTFATLIARSVPAQSQPYPPLADVVAAQTVFPLEQVRATLVGFRTGSDLLGVGAPGLHLHGLTRSRDAGGHILSCTTGDDVRLTIQRTRGVRLVAAP
jgi:acetolactate decarboxylase